jgi:hypothetical protein
MWTILVENMVTLVLALSRTNRCRQQITAPFLHVTLETSRCRTMVCERWRNIKFCPTNVHGFCSQYFPQRLGWRQTDCTVPPSSPDLTYSCGCILMANTQGRNLVPNQVVGLKGNMCRVLKEMPYNTVQGMICNLRRRYEKVLNLMKDILNMCLFYFIFLQF